MKADMFNLEGRIALVTGSTRGLGLAMAEALAAAGATLAITGRSGGDEAVAKIEAEGGKARYFNFDLSDLNGLQGFVHEISSSLGPIDILVNNAGTQRRYPAEIFPMQDWQEVLNINLTAPFFLCQAVGRTMLDRGKGKIINIASLLSFQGGLTVPAYAASKGAVVQFTKALANEWAGKGVNVNAIAPGYMETEMNSALMADPVRCRQIGERIPAGRWGKPEDMAGAVVYLASKASDYVHGSVLVVDGGWMGR